MDIAAALAEIQALPVQERFRIAQAIWEGIEAEQGGFEVPDSHRRELERRLADVDANPDDEFERDEVMNWLRSQP